MDSFAPEVQQYPVEVVIPSDPVKARLVQADLSQLHAFWNHEFEVQQTHKVGQAGGLFRFKVQTQENRAFFCSRRGQPEALEKLRFSQEN